MVMILYTEIKSYKKREMLITFQALGRYSNMLCQVMTVCFEMQCLPYIFIWSTKIFLIKVRKDELLEEWLDFYLHQWNYRHIEWLYYTFYKYLTEFYIFNTKYVRRDINNLIYTKEIFWVSVTFSLISECIIYVQIFLKFEQSLSNTRLMGFLTN